MGHVQKAQACIWTAEEIDLSVDGLILIVADLSLLFMIHFP
jgi:hypothetical protein